jgi:DNA-binding beta-propeller fold protein YncE
MIRLVFVSLIALACRGQAPTFPPLSYRAVPGWPQLPPHWYQQETAGVAVTPGNHVYVLHRGRHPILEFDSDGWFVRGFGDGLFDRAHSIRVDRDGNLWTVDDGSHTVLKMDKHGRVLMVFGRFRLPSDAPGSMPDGSAGGALRGLRDEGIIRFKRPTDVAVGPGGDIFVSDGYGNSRIVKFDKEGRFVKEWGRRGGGPGEFHTPHSVVVDEKGMVYVADRENYRIQVFDADGKFVSQWRDIGSPWGLALTNDGNLLMSDGYNNRVLKLTKSGRVVGAFGSHGKQPGQFHYCHQLAAGPDGAVYTAEILNWRAQKFVPK